MPSPYWDRVEEVYKLGLPRNQQALLLYLLHRADFKTGRCSPGLAKLRAELSLTTRSILNARKELRSGAHITWVVRTAPGELHEATEYRLSHRWVVSLGHKGGSIPGSHKPTTTSVQRTALCTGCGKPMRTRKDPSKALCRPCLQANARSTPANVVKMFPENH